MERRRQCEGDIEKRESGKRNDIEKSIEGKWSNKKRKRRREGEKI